MTRCDGSLLLDRTALDAEAWPDALRRLSGAAAWPRFGCICRHCLLVEDDHELTVRVGSVSRNWLVTILTASAMASEDTRPP